MSRVKIITYVPLDYADKVREAFGNAGAGKIGKYSFCSFSTRGEGRSMPLEGAEPFYGKQGEVSIEQEERIEVVCERDLAKKVIEEMKKVHPYEEVAYEIIELIDEDTL
jgi:hypothetical protein